MFWSSPNFTSFDKGAIIPPFSNCWNIVLRYLALSRFDAYHMKSHFRNWNPRGKNAEPEKLKNTIVVVVLP